MTISQKHQKDLSLSVGDAEQPTSTSTEVREDNSENSGDDAGEEHMASRKGCYVKLLVGLILVAIIAYVIVDASTAGNIQRGLTIFLDWIKDNTLAGFFLFMVVYFIATVFFIPGSILTLGAGFIFSAAFGLGPGVALGTLSVFLGASLGAIASFFLGRYLLHEQAKKLSQKYAVFEALDAALASNGLKIFILLRLSPIIPFNAINYIGGVSAVTARAYILALFAILPGTILYVFLGASAGSLTESASSGSDPTVTIIVVVVGVVFGILAICMTTRYAKKELNRVIEERKAAEEKDNNSDASGTGDVEAEADEVIGNDIDVEAQS